MAITMNLSAVSVNHPMGYILDGTCRVVHGWNGASMIDSIQKMEFSYAYIHAVASHAGFLCERRSIDINSVDLTIRADHLISPMSRILAVMDFQVKATSSHSFKNGVLSLPLPLKNYNQLRCETSAPILLIVFIMPDRLEDWLDHNEQRLITRRCAYWHNLKGLPRVANTDNVTVHIKQKNLFSPSSMTELMLRASKNDGMGVGHEV